MYFEIEKQAIDALNKALDQYDEDIDRNFRLDFPPDPKLGDLASTIAFALTKKLKTSPNLVAEDLVSKIEVPDIFEKVQNFGPYVNFFIDYSKFSKQLLEKVDENYGQLEKVDEKVVLEHTSANPNGPLHIGHVRNSIFGDSLARLLKLAGREVETQYYVNDMGRQIAIIVYGITEMGLVIDEQEGEKIDEKIGKLYFLANKEVEENEAANERVSELIQTYEKGDDAELNAVFEDVVSKCVSGIKDTLHRINIYHDDFVWEGQFIRNGDVDALVKYFEKEGFVSHEEVDYIDLKFYNIEKEFVLRRSNGTSLYSTRDLAYHRYKATLGDLVLDILGSDHKLSSKQMKVIFEEILREKAPEVIFYEFITLPEGSMSTRRGKFVSVDDLVDEAISRAAEEIKSRNPDLSDEEIAPMAEQIGIGAIRFFIAKLSPEKHLTFKWDEALSFERGCASIQYAHARACKLLNKSGKDVSALEIADDWVPNDAEQDLVRLIAKFPQVVEECANKKRVHNVTQYCQDLAGSFNKFYKSEQVIGSDLEDTRLILVDKSKTVIKNALDILGVPAPEKM
ncbi:arginine--tRNA ligase [Methanobrevibacter millerae]|uniref:Arginine--tRNA ligase n=1 Tax=Methanobrevibacter millerae TaxID=230361 RepID=A0A1G5XQF5_9EURY|nr:arginine--tRNA ligase [Methanobrevibacter millerae]SDA71805.1 arginyl-tRNA synthetase [Methanobrevibacter millerae]